MSTPPFSSDAAPREPSRSPSPEPRTYTRAPPVGLGDRLASARCLAPDAAPPPPPPRPTVATDTSVASLLRPSVFPPLGADMAAKYVPKYGSVKGSYIGPFDSGGKTPGDKHLPASSTTYEEFEAKYGSAARAAAQDAQSETSHDSDRTIGPSAGTISFGMMPSVVMHDKGKGRAVSVSEKVAVPPIPEGASTPHLTSACYLNNH